VSQGAAGHFASLFLSLSETRDLEQKRSNVDVCFIAGNPVVETPVDDRLSRTYHEDSLPIRRIASALQKPKKIESFRKSDDGVNRDVHRPQIGNAPRADGALWIAAERDGVLIVDPQGEIVKRWNHHIGELVQELTPLIEPARCVS
jgi:hypothetical protein